MDIVFRGPLFIVGMPRSGTKLMRALLNQHPQINLTLAESHFIPYFLRKYGNPPRFSATEDLMPFVRDLQQTAFYATMRKVGYGLDASTFLRNIDYTSWSAIFEHTFRYFGSKRLASNTIWGDKTPGYINHLPLLKTLFPEAKFLHMIRDPRDYCLSVRKSFAKSIYRAASRWTESVRGAHGNGVQFGAEYKEVRYELLLENPRLTMTDVAGFLGIPYHDCLVDLTSAPEDLGDAKGHRGIVTNNSQKYRTQLSPSEIKGVEEVVCDVAKSVGYRLENDVTCRSLNSLTLGVLKLHDGIASLRHHIAAEGEITNGVRRLVRHYRISSWRLVTGPVLRLSKEAQIRN